ncbi:putative cyclin [Rosa chinensis]|uniref:B-like cyclin n=1 Tax=Rosa chinensis TaxID=74649 RepID=A0A2P6SEQ2_ROSCH|nr:putative cyclin [Rosa chinensis]
MQLLAVACLSHAAKMEEINVPISLDLQELTSWNLNLQSLQQQ